MPLQADAMFESPKFIRDSTLLHLPSQNHFWAEGWEGSEPAWLQSSATASSCLDCLSLEIGQEAARWGLLISSSYVAAKDLGGGTGEGKGCCNLLLECFLLLCHQPLLQNRLDEDSVVQNWLHSPGSVSQVDVHEVRLVRVPAPWKLQAGNLLSLSHRWSKVINTFRPVVSHKVLFLCLLCDYYNE